MGAVAAIALGLWALFVTALAFATRPRTPDADPPTSEMGEEQPAIANLLTNGWRVEQEAVPATLIDLAARGFLAIEQVAPGRTIVKVPEKSEGDGELAGFERHVLSYVRSLAHDGVVPAGALTTGPQEHARGWMKEFADEVVEDARTRGLARKRWGPGAMAAMVGSAVVPAILIAAAVLLLPPDKGIDDSDDNLFAAMFYVSAGAWVMLAAIPASLRANRDTAEGLRAASRWLGLRQYLADNEAVADQPPAGVAVWERYMAYGVALGVAPRAARAIPMGAESDRVAWSSFGGTWRVVHISYPTAFPAGWGKSPMQAMGEALVGLIIVGVIWLAFGTAVPEIIADIAPDIRGPGGTVQLVVVLMFLVMYVALIIATLYFGSLMVMGVLDIRARETFTGAVLRMRKKPKKTAYIAIDDGRSPRIRAYSLGESLPGHVSQGDVVKVTVSPRLRHVFAIESA